MALIRRSLLCGADRAQSVLSCSDAVQLEIDDSHFGLPACDASDIARAELAIPHVDTVVQRQLGRRKCIKALGSDTEPHLAHVARHNRVVEALRSPVRQGTRSVRPDPQRS